jgi:hypothetical protein
LKTSALGLSLLTLLSTAYGQEPSPREQFQAAVAAYQKEKGSTQENALKVIVLFKQLDPPPAVPEEARKPFVMGATMLQESKDAVGAAKAVEQFGKALQIAPWFAEAWYNRALARETAGQFGAAMGDLKVYLEFKLADAERREAKDKSYALEAKAEIAAARKAEEAKAAAAKAAAKAAGPDFSGEWLYTSGEVKGRLALTIERSGDGWVVRIPSNAKSPITYKPQGRTLLSDLVTDAMTFHHKCTLSDDDQTMDLAQHASQTPAQQAKTGITLNDHQVRHETLKRK